MQILWFLPTQGDGRHLASATGGRAVTHRYLRQIAEAADDLGYYITACCCLPGAAARMLGSWPHP
jgi:hypothetical protein